MAPSIAGTQSSLSPPASRSERPGLRSPSHSYRWFRGNKLIHYSVLHTMLLGTLPSALKQMTTASKTYCNYKAAIEWSSDAMRYWTVTFQKLHVSGHILCNSCEFLTKNHTLEGVWENFVAPYTQAKEGTNLTNKFEGRRLATFFLFSSSSVP
jgi:hypothetical protein